MAKKPITIYLSDDDLARLNEIYSYRLLGGLKVTRSMLMQEALSLLYTEVYLSAKREAAMEKIYHVKKNKYDAELESEDRESLINDEPEA